ncbi:Bax inhibitor-1/YccA family protein [Georgenia sp. Z1344]|uniref:Bax inhibitor-1/YccA family protein n=1 Tax=Georgenia sp. Z1344 TaxID=3416706 RepID=UPI003CEDFBCC
MSNPYFNRSVFSDDPRQRSRAAASTATAPQGYGQPGYAQQGQAGFGQQTQPGSMPMGGFEQQYSGAAAAPADTGRLTFDDVIVKSGLVLGTVILVGLATAFLTPIENAFLPMIVGAIGGLVLGIVNAVRRSPSPALILAYAALEGLFLGAFSMVLEGQFPGIVIQAVLATFAVATVTLLLYTSRAVRVTPKLTRFMLIGMLGYGLFSLVNFGMMIFGFSDDPWGMRSGVEIMGIPLGILVGAFAVLLAVFSLLHDFDGIERGVNAGLPRKYAWAAAFGLAVTLIWLYVEILRILAILRGND